MEYFQIAVVILVTACSVSNAQQYAHPLYGHIGHAAAPLRNVASLPVAYSGPKPVAYAAAPVQPVPVAKVAKAIVPEQYHPYSFGYSVHDVLTGDSHSHTESRDDNNVVRGQYQLVETDGSLRTVTYIANSLGFNAVVDRSAPTVVAKTAVVPKVHAQPVPAVGHYAGPHLTGPQAYIG